MKTRQLEKRERNPQFNPDNGLRTWPLSRICWAQLVSWSSGTTLRSRSFDAAPAGRLLDHAHEIAKGVLGDPSAYPAAAHYGLIWSLEESHDSPTGKLGADLEPVEGDDHTRRPRLFDGLCIALIKGLIRDRAIFHGFDVIDARDWIA